MRSCAPRIGAVFLALLEAALLATAALADPQASAGALVFFTGQVLRGPAKVIPPLMVALVLGGVVGAWSR